ncbi:hypothetical protein BOTBODRAFT_47402 [Botryobasidium botryosum FD-172 SS1]|uniref:Uncharacterized protein n=1 Tax=Botryobasidium botryosum (strain FD-172 SS1) TaxID=930990 RepID=A0A067M2L1_BOTB1|nr:hypothetical protein BOTBODRAFT_47402 [Botryobasidium botryosum FD-172 SS1]
MRAKQRVPIVKRDISRRRKCVVKWERSSPGKQRIRDVYAAVNAGSPERPQPVSLLLGFFANLRKARDTPSLRTFADVQLFGETQPAVKFRDLDATIFGKTPLTDDAPPPPNPDEPKGSCPQEDDRVRVAGGDDEGDEWLDEPGELIPPATAFELDEGAVALDSPVLLDILSDKPIAAAPE